MKELLKKGLYLGVGAFTLTKEKIEQVVDEMVRRGDAEQGDKAKLIDELVERTREFEKELSEKVKGIIQTYGYVPRRDLEDLKKRIEALEKELAAKKPGSRKPAAKAAPRKSTRKKSA